jgi:small subunit ribosomal protein S1
VGDLAKGKVTKLTSFGVFVELENDLEGLLHISELADRKVETPEEIVQVGEELEVRVIRVDIRDRKIGLSLRQVAYPDENLAEMAEMEEPHEAMMEEEAPREMPSFTTSNIAGLDALANRISGQAAAEEAEESGPDGDDAASPEAPADEDDLESDGSTSLDDETDSSDEDDETVE